MGFYPSSFIVEENFREDGGATSDFIFPAVAKPGNADGSTESHQMSLVFNKDGLKEVQKQIRGTIVLQEFINHDAVLHKIYCLGDKEFMGVRPSLPNIPKGKEPFTNKNFEFFGRISKDEDPNCRPLNLPSMEFVHHLCSKLRLELGLSLFGIDLITRSDSPNQHYIIDVNYFPSYDGMPLVPETFADQFHRCAKNAFAVSVPLR